MPEVRLLRERLAAARKLGESIRTALPGLAGGPRRRKGEAETTLEGLQALRAAAVTLRCDVPFYPVLCFALDRLEAWAGRVKQLLGMRAPLADLRALIEESRELPAAMPEVETVEVRKERGLGYLSVAGLFKPITSSFPAHSPALSCSSRSSPRAWPGSRACMPWWPRARP